MCVYLFTLAQAATNTKLGSGTGSATISQSLAELVQMKTIMLPSEVCHFKERCGSEDAVACGAQPVGWRQPMQPFDSFLALILELCC
jgi:hypothetical protein